MGGSGKRRLTRNPVGNPGESNGNLGPQVLSTHTHTHKRTTHVDIYAHTLSLVNIGNVRSKPSGEGDRDRFRESDCALYTIHGYIPTYLYRIPVIPVLYHRHSRV